MTTADKAFLERLTTIKQDHFLVLKEFLDALLEEMARSKNEAEKKRLQEVFFIAREETEKTIKTEEALSVLLKTPTLVASN